MTTLTEEKVLTSVTLNIENNSIDVKWDNRIKRGEELISAIPHRVSYTNTPDRVRSFMAEVEGHTKFMDAMGWQDPGPEQSQD